MVFPLLSFKLPIPYYCIGNYGNQDNNHDYWRLIKRWVRIVSFCLVEFLIGPNLDKGIAWFGVREELNPICLVSFQDQINTFCFLEA